MRYYYEASFKFEGDIKACKKYITQGRQLLQTLMDDSNRNNLDITINERVYDLDNGVIIKVKLSPTVPIIEIYVPEVEEPIIEDEITADFTAIISYGETKWTNGITASTQFTYCNQNLLDLSITITHTDESQTVELLKDVAFFPHIPVVDHVGDIPPMTGTVEDGVKGLPLPYVPTDEEFSYQPASDSQQYALHQISRGFISNDTTREIETVFGYVYGNTDWKGSDGTVLTWNAPPGRCLEGLVEWGRLTYPSATNRQLEFPDYHPIFYDGELLNFAPGHVSGCAVYHRPIDTKDPPTTEPWLVVACHVYNYRDDLAAFYRTREFSFYARKINQEMNHTAFEYAIYEAINQKRAEFGLPAFYLIETDTNVARDWANYMAIADDYVHGDFQQRFIDNYDSFAWYAENLIQYTSGALDPVSLVNYWMISPGHKDNILYNLLQGNEVGGAAGIMIGVSTTPSPNGNDYVVCDFMQPIMIPPGFGAQEWVSGGSYIYDHDVLSTFATQYYKGIQPCFFGPNGDKAVTQRISSTGAIEKVDIEFDFSLLGEGTPSFTFIATEDDAAGTPRTLAFDYDINDNIVSATVETVDELAPFKGDNLVLNVNGTKVPTSFVDWWYQDEFNNIRYDDINLGIATIYPMLYLDPRHSLAAYIEIYGTDRNTGSGSVKYFVEYKGEKKEIASFPNSHIMDVPKFTTNFGSGSELIYNYQHWSLSQSFFWMHKGWYAVDVNDNLIMSQVCTDNVWSFWKNDEYFYPGIGENGAPTGTLPDITIDNLLTYSRDDLKMADQTYVRADDKYPFDSGSPGEVKIVNLWGLEFDIFDDWNINDNDSGQRLIKNISPYNSDNTLNRTRMRTSYVITTVLNGNKQEVT